jgi:hypothetical protein
VFGGSWVILSLSSSRLPAMDASISDVPGGSAAVGLSAITLDSLQSGVGAIVDETLPASFNEGLGWLLSLKLPFENVWKIFEFVGVQKRCYMCQEKPGLCVRVAGGFDWICLDCWWILQPAEPGYDYWLMELSEMSGRTMSPFSGSQVAWHGTTLASLESEQDYTESIAP